MFSCNLLNIKSIIIARQRFRIFFRKFSVLVRVVFQYTDDCYIIFMENKIRTPLLQIKLDVNDSLVIITLLQSHICLSSSLSFFDNVFIINSFTLLCITTMY